MRQYMHQHPFEAPVVPNRLSSAGQRSKVSGLIVKSIMASSSASADHPFLCGFAGHTSPARSALDLRLGAIVFLDGGHGSRGIVATGSRLTWPLPVSRL